MAAADTKEMLKNAGEQNYAVGAFNVTNLIQFEAVVEAAEEYRAPVIVQTSVTPSKFLQPQVIAAVYRTLADSASIPVCLHLDHCDNIEYCRTCADAGYTNIMIDASKQDFEENIRQTKEVAEFCHGLEGITVEGELGTVSGVEDQVRVAGNAAVLADPDTAVEFVSRTGIDSFAPAIGTAHGVYKTADPQIDFQRFGSIRRHLDEKGIKVPLVVHGGTGLPAQTVQRLVGLGCAKFNVSTALKHTLIDTTYEYVSSHRQEYNPGKIDKAVKAAIKKLVWNWMDVLGCRDKA